MPDETLNDLLPTTPDLRAERLAELKRLFPDLFTNEGRLDPDELKRLVAPNEVHETERYEFKWYGKAASKREAFTPTTATLVYDEARSVNPDKADGNMIIEGENLEVLKLLLSGYAEQVDVIYIDPPYNADADVIYTDNFASKKADYWEETGDAQGGVKLTSNPDSRGNQHSDWLCMLQMRLLVARRMLTDSGVIFVSIDDKEHSNLTRLMDEVFGRENFLGNIVWKGATDNNPTRVAIEHEYVVCYAKNTSRCPAVWKDATDDTKHLMLRKYREIADVTGEDSPETITAFRRFIRDNFESLQPLTHYSQIDARGPYTGSRKVHNPKPGGYQYDVPHEVDGEPTGEICEPPANGYRFPWETMKKLLDDDRILFGATHRQIVQIKEYLEDYEAKLPSVIALDSRTGSNEIEAVFGERKIFPNPKPTLFMNEFLRFLLKDNSLLLDFYAGSGSSLHAALKHHPKCKWIGVQIPEETPGSSPASKAGYKTISAITIERIKRVIQGYGDTPEPKPDTGFRVYKLAKSNFPRCEFVPDVKASEEENVAALKRYIHDKEAASLLPLEAGAEQAVFDEVLLKCGFQLHYTRQRREDFADNTVHEVSDGHRRALVCLAWNEGIKDATLKRLRELDEAGEKPFFICLERSLSTTTKWNLDHLLGKRLTAF